MSWIEFLIELDKKISLATGKINDELASEAETYRQRLQWVIENIKMNPTNWIISDIKEENNEVARVEIKPLDVSHYIKHIFRHCDKTLMMSATILDKDAFCSSVGLASEQVKFIRVGSDFPLQNRPIYPLNIEYLNYKTLGDDRVKQKIAAAVDEIMIKHKDHKGIIHTTSYTQLNFIKENISESNRRRLLETNPEVERDEIIDQHINTIKP